MERAGVHVGGIWSPARGCKAAAGVPSLTSCTDACPAARSQGWHPGSFKNTEKVWKKEAEAEAEQRKLEELRKQLEDEKKANEYVEIAESAGHKR
jgi:hypothetical protein